MDTDRGTASQTKYLFVDDAFIAARQGVVRILHPATKLDRPVLEPEHPWEGQRVYTYGTVYYDRVARLFQMWYMSSLSSRHTHRFPELGHSAADLNLYATSEDGLHWEKPRLHLHEFDGSRENNIVYDLHSPSVIVDEAEMDPDRRFKMVGVGRIGKTGYWASFSPDGLLWRDYPDNPIIPGSDTITATRDPNTGRYLAFHKQQAEVRGHKRRTVWLSTSPDFQKWSKPELILAPDEEDDRWVERPEQRTEFYVMSGFPYGGYFLGLLSVFRVEKVYPSVLPDQSSHDGPIEIQLVHSRDGLKWQRFEDRSPIIARGEPGMFDGGCIMACSNPPAVHGDQAWVCYTAITTGHGGAMPEKRITVGRASWRLDGFVSLEAKEGPGLVETASLDASGDRLLVNADAAHGNIQVEVLSAGGDPLPGYSAEECEVLRTDSVRHQVRWRGRSRLPEGRPLRLRLHLDRASLYSVTISSG